MTEETEIKLRKSINNVAKKYKTNILYGTLDTTEKENSQFIGGVCYGAKKEARFTVVDLLETSSRLHQFIRERTKHILLKGRYNI